eukprot:6846842-Prymnesium_polylepis.1
MLSGTSYGTSTFAVAISAEIALDAAVGASLTHCASPTRRRPSHLVRVRVPVTRSPGMYHRPTSVRIR